VDVASIETELRESSSARVPSAPRGRAIVFTRYHEEKAVVMNPEDFRRLHALDLALDEIATDGVTPPGELLLRAHSLEDTPAEPIEDPAGIRALLGL